MNAFNNPSIDDNIVIFGVAFKSASGGRGVGGGMEAEYQVGVWGIKTLSLTRDLTPASGRFELRSCSVRVGMWPCVEYSCNVLA